MPTACVADIGQELRQRYALVIRAEELTDAVLAELVEPVRQFVEVHPLALVGRAVPAARAGALSATPDTLFGVLPRHLRKGQEYLLRDDPAVAAGWIYAAGHDVFQFDGVVAVRLAVAVGARDFNLALGMVLPIAQC